MKLQMTAIVILCSILFASMVCKAQALPSGKWFLDSIQAPSGLTPSPKAKPVVIAIVDDGARTSHQELQKFIWQNPLEKVNGIDDDGNGKIDDINGWDVADNDNTITPPRYRYREFYHGTHLAGIITRIAGRAYGPSAPEHIKIMVVKSMADKADKAYLKTGYKGIAYAVESGADIIVCAWGVGQMTPREAAIIQKAEDKGVLVVASAGNFPEEKEQYPAAHKAVFAVTALDENDQKVPRANYGAFIDLAVPGIHIESSSVLSDTGYERRGGTSYGVPMVAAAAAVVKLQHPGFSMEQVKACLKNSAVVIDPANPELAAKTGAGKLNIAQALSGAPFAQEAQTENFLFSHQGYLHFNGRLRSAAWSIAPKGVFKGFRFRSVVGPTDTGNITITFYPQAAPEAKPLASFPLSALPENFFLSGTTAYVTITSENNDQQENILLEYRAEPINFSTLYCRETQYLDVEGHFSDGSGSERYANRSACKWLITAPEDKVIHFNFTEFDTEANTDLLYFFNGAGTHEKIMAVFSGPNLPPELTTWGNQVLVWFVTNGSQRGRGWQGDYRFIDPN